MSACFFFSLDCISAQSAARVSLDVAVLASNCSDIITAASTTLAAIADELPELYMDLVTTLTMTLDGATVAEQLAYPMGADSDLLAAIDCLEDDVDSLERVADRTMNRNAKSRLERVLASISRSLRDLFAAANGFPSVDPAEPTVVDAQLTALATHLVNALNARNDVFACFDMPEEGTDGGDAGQIP